MGFENGLETMQYQLLSSKKVQVDLKRSETGGNDPSTRHWKKIKKRRYTK